MKLDKNQTEFILQKFFRDERFAGWRNIGMKLINNGKCIIAGGECPWIGGVGNFIQTKTTSGEFEGCVELHFNVEEFTSKDNLLYNEVYVSHMKELTLQRDALQEKIESLKSIRK